MKTSVESRQPRSFRRRVTAAFLISGVAGLVHEVVWAKLLATIIGATAYAQAVVLAVFMGGLTIGSIFFGRRVDQLGHPLRTYVRLEVAIGAYCLAVPLLLHVAGLGYVALAARWFESTGLLLFLRLGLATLVTLLPAVLMGGTLPVLARHLVERLDQTQHQVGKLYALNSFGAMLGAGVAGFLALPLLGLYESLGVACALNFVAAAIIAAPAFDGRSPASPAGSTASGSDSASTACAVQKPRDHRPFVQSLREGEYRPGVYTATLIALALSGFAALGYEVLFTRIIALSFGSSTYSFTVMLMCFTAGIGLGSAVVSRLDVKDPLWTLGLCQLAVVLALILVTPLISRLPYLIGLLRIDLREASWGFELHQAAKAALIFVVLALPTVCLGAGFPLVARIQARRVDLLGGEVGFTYAANTLGNVLGVVLTTLVLLPGLGLLGAFHFSLALNLIAGAAFLMLARHIGLADRLAALGAALVAVAVYVTTGTAWPDPINLAVGHLRLERPRASISAAGRALHPAASYESWTRVYVVGADATPFYFAEDAHATVLAYGKGNDVVLAVNGKPDASTRGDLETQLLLAHLPLFANPAARAMLAVGYGSGITIGSALQHPLERVDVAEISRGVIGADAVFARFNHGAGADLRVRVYHDDGQSFLRSVPRRYDVVVSEPSNPWIAGVAGLFTVEYFSVIREKLNPGGVAAIWFHEYEQSTDSIHLVLRTLRSVFPHVEVFRTAGDSADIVAVGTAGGWVPDFGAMERRFELPAIRHDLARIRIPNLAGLLRNHVIPAAHLPQLLPAGPLNTQRHQILEYSAPRSLFTGESSDFLERAEKSLREQGGGETLLERYVAYRRETGSPLRDDELPREPRRRRGSLTTEAQRSQR